MSNLSPFRQIRWEQEPVHFYYLPHELRERMEVPRSALLIGSRGTGKTTLLKALHWKERLSNESLAAAIGEPSPLAGGFVGTYLKLPTAQLQLLDAWSSACGEEFRASVFSTYLDLLLVQDLADALGRLRTEGHLDFSAEQEHRFVRLVADRYPIEVKEVRWLRDGTLHDLGRSMERLRQYWEACARSRVDPARISAMSVLGAPGMVGRNITEFLAQLASPQAQIHFKFCLDEAECLTRFQQRVLNTMMRLAQFPLTYVAAFVRSPTELNKTVIPSLSLQHADRDIIELEGHDGAVRFPDFVDGVAAIRCSHMLGRDVRFVSRQVFGDLHVNAIIAEILKESVSPQARDLEVLASELATANDNLDEELPYYEAYLVSRLSIELETRTEGWKARRQQSAEIRKKMVAAYLSICADLRVSPRYQSADMLLGMSDHCIRDFLNQVHEVFRAAQCSLDTFVANLVSNGVQQDGLLAASEVKAKAIRKSGVGSPRVVEKLVEALARITSRVQSRSSTQRHLRSSELGIFVLPPPDPSNESSVRQLEHILEAAEAGYFRVVEHEDVRGLAFRVHASLAPTFRFSYRGAYYRCGLTWADIDSICSANDRDRLQTLVEEVSARISGDESLPLFEDQS